MIELNQEQLAQALDVMRAYLAAPSSVEGKSLIEYESELDSQRVSVIENELKPAISSYLTSEITLAEFKTKVDSINKRKELWGFKGIKGQMFFNMVLNVADDLVECDNQIKSSIQLPASETLAASKINTFIGYVRRIGDQHVEAGGTKQGRPNVASVPFFLSYFWQVLDREVWPVYYTNSVSVMTDLNLWQPTGDLASDYIAYKSLQETLAKVFTNECSRTFTLYDVEHVFWFKGGKPYQGGKPAVKGTTGNVLGQPLRSLAWLANWLARHGEGLKSGQLVASGSCTGMTQVGTDDLVVAKFGDRAQVRVEIASTGDKREVRA